MCKSHTYILNFFSQGPQYSLFYLPFSETIFDQSSIRVSINPFPICDKSEWQIWAVGTCLLQISPLLSLTGFFLPAASRQHFLKIQRSLGTVVYSAQRLIKVQIMFLNYTVIVHADMLWYWKVCLKNSFCKYKCGNICTIKPRLVSLLL